MQINIDDEELKNILLSKREIKPSPDGRYQDCWYWTGYASKKFKYGILYFSTNGIGLQIRIHRLSAYLWSGFDLSSKLSVCHKCDNRICFNFDHLFVGTHTDNMRDMISKGRDVRIGLKGSKNKAAKLDEEDILEIRKYHKDKEFSIIELAAMYKVSYVTIYRIIRNSHWRHVNAIV